MFSHSDSSSEIRLNLVLGLLDCYLLFHTVLDLRCVLIASLKLGQLLIFLGNVCENSFSLELGLILPIPFGLIVRLNSLILPSISLLFFLESCLFNYSLELSFLGKFVTNLTLFFFASEQLSPPVVSDFLIKNKINIRISTNMNAAVPRVFHASIAELSALAQIVYPIAIVCKTSFISSLTEREAFLSTFLPYFIFMMFPAFACMVDMLFGIRYWKWF